MFFSDGMTAVAIFWIAIVLIVFVGSFFRYRERVSRHRMLERLAEKGQAIPPEEIARDRDPYYDRYYTRGIPPWRHGWGWGWGWGYGHSLSSGIYLIFVGIALFLFLWALTGRYNFFGANDFFGGDHIPNWLPFVAVFPFMAGVARIVAYIVDRPREK